MTTSTERYGEAPAGPGSASLGKGECCGAAPGWFSLPGSASGSRGGQPCCASSRRPGRGEQRPRALLPAARLLARSRFALGQRTSSLRLPVSSCSCSCRPAQAYPALSCCGRLRFRQPNLPGTVNAAWSCPSPAAPAPPSPYSGRRALPLSPRRPSVDLGPGRPRRGEGAAFAAVCLEIQVTLKPAPAARKLPLFATCLSVT